MTLDRLRPSLLSATVRMALASAVAASVTVFPGKLIAQERSQPAETVVEIRIHGNVSVADSEVLALSGVALGDVAGPDLVHTVRARLEATGCFETVEVHRRYRSLSTTDEIALVIVVRERIGARFSNPIVRALASVGRRMMVAPIVNHKEGYGVAFGALTSVLDAFGSENRLSVPVTWGGHKYIALNMEAPIGDPVIDYLLVSASRGRRRHPYFDVDDERTQLKVEAERRLPRGFRVNGEIGWEEVHFASRAERLIRSAVHVDYGDYRETPVTARKNTASLRVGVERLKIIGHEVTVIRPLLDARVYAAVGDQAVFAARFFVKGASGPLPAYEQVLLGGSPAVGGTLRGWPAGVAVGDRIALASVELRLPLNSLLSDRRFGLRLFYDTAAVFETNRPFRDVSFREGAGGGVYFIPSRFVPPVSIDVAHDFDGRVRVHASAGFGF